MLHESDSCALKVCNGDQCCLLLILHGRNKAQATELSKKGKDYNAKMKVLHLRAETEIF